MEYNKLMNENMILYKTLARKIEKEDKIKEILKNINFFDISYRELYNKLLKIYEVMEVYK